MTACTWSLGLLVVKDGFFPNAGDVGFNDGKVDNRERLEQEPLDPQRWFIERVIKRDAVASCHWGQLHGRTACAVTKGPLAYLDLLSSSWRTGDPAFHFASQIIQTIPLIIDLQFPPLKSHKGKKIEILPETRLRFSICLLSLLTICSSLTAFFALKKYH